MAPKNDLCLIIPHFNNYDGLIRSLNSLKEDIDFDILIIDDGSDEKLPEDEFFNKTFQHLNFIILRNEHTGIIHVSIEGIEFVDRNDYTYTARLDAGDLCMPNRLTIQRQYFIDHPDVYLLGTYCEYFDLETNQTLAIKRFPTNIKAIKRQVYFNSMFEHPTIMFRVKAVKEIGNYPIEYKVAMDYAYFFKFIKRYNCTIIPQVLIRKEISSTSISTVKRKLQVFNRMRAIIENFSFKWYCFAGLAYTATLYIIPYSVLNKLKRYFFK